jgi:hypothetical protein
MKRERDPYEILGVTPDATYEKVRSAYRAAAKRSHPDRFVSYVQKVLATARMQELNDAYAVLRDPEKRRAYDARHHVTNPTPHPAAETHTVRTAVQEPPPRTSSRFSVFHVIGVGCWIATSAAYAYWLGIDPTPLSVLDYIAVIGVSIIVAPLLLGVAIMLLAVPVVIVWQAFSASYSDASLRLRGTTQPHVARDVATRVLMLVGVFFVLVLMIRFEINSDLLAIGVIGGAASLIGEIAAMALYFVRRRQVIATTEILLQG